MFFHRSIKKSPNPGNPSQPINMPVMAFTPTQVATKTCFQTTRPEGAANIEVFSWWKVMIAEFTNAHHTGGR
jgi:hypothetical protein